MVVNVNSARNKLEVINELINKKIDVIALVGTRANIKADMPEFNDISFHHFTKESTKAGGITIYASKKYKPQCINDPEEIHDIKWTHLKLHMQEVAVVIVYFKVVDGCRPEDRIDNMDYNDETALMDKTTKLYKANVEVIIRGDFNAHIGDNTHPRGIQNNPQINPNHNGRNLVIFINEMGLTHFFEMADLEEGQGT